MLEILLLAISKDILSNWLKDEPNLLQRISEEFIDKCSEFSNHNKTENDLSIEKIANSIVQQCRPLFDVEANSLEESSKEAIILEVVNTLKVCQITSEILVAINLDENRLAQLFQVSGTEAVKLFSQTETALYQRLLLEISRAVISNSSKLPSFQKSRDAELLKRTNANAKERSYTQDQLRLINDDLLEVLRRLPDPQKNNEKDVLEILAEAEAKNPGLRFQLTQTPDAPFMLSCTVKEQGINPEIGRLSFPNTELGKLGQQKYRELIEKDISAKFYEGEANWNWSIQLPQFFDEPMIVKEFSLSGLSFVDEILPVKLEFLDLQGTVLDEINYANLRVERLGTKEQEVRIDGKKIPGILTFVANQVSNQTSMSHTSSIFDRTPDDGLSLEEISQALEFRALLAESQKIQVIHLEEDKLIFSAGNKVETAPGFPRYLRCRANLFKWLAAINNHFGTSLFPPDEVDIDTYTTAEEVFLIITKGEFQDGGGRINAQYETSYAKRILDTYRAYEDPDNNAEFVIKDGEIRLSLLEEGFLGQAEITLRGLSLAEDVNILREKISLAQGDDFVEIAMNYQSSYKKYLSLNISQS